MNFTHNDISCGFFEFNCMDFVRIHEFVRHFPYQKQFMILPFHHNVQVYLSYNPMVSSIIGYNYADQYNPITDSDVYTSILLHFLFRVPRTD